ncbi:hypothetical protein BDU57DRAFT_539982 [Ampelomyces quisqualis]|uniref:Survival protein sure-like phosphatase/nucleotidase n=1 Tax=Ampelomyces quisqualis TaxID=50730 RepID=A0A6A5QL68_AMPQU|nr:hypothetical protein BDU57DRAFT_539982 [Ampelomyces quisqualis]
MLKFYLLLAIALPLTQAIRLFLTNREGWEHRNIRSLFHVLDTPDDELLLCAPKTGGDLKRPTTPNSLVQVPDDLDDDVFPFTIELGLKFRAPLVYKWMRDSDPPITSPDTQEPWKADLILVGPNNGSILGNRGYHNQLWWIQGMAGDGYPMISFAGANGTFSDPVGLHEARSEIYAKLAKHVIQTLVAKPLKKGESYIPKHTFLSVNFPDPFSSNQRCTEVSHFKFILTSHWRYDSHFVPDLSLSVLKGYNPFKFPYEKKVVKSQGCYVAITHGQRWPWRHRTFNGHPIPNALARQKIIARLEPILSPFPNNLPLVTEDEN